MCILNCPLFCSFPGNLKAKQNLNYTHTLPIKIKYSLQKILVWNGICKPVICHSFLLICAVSSLSFLQSCKTSEPSLDTREQHQVFSLSSKINYEVIMSLLGKGSFSISWFSPPKNPRSAPEMSTWTHCSGKKWKMRLFNFSTSVCCLRWKEQPCHFNTTCNMSVLWYSSWIYHEVAKPE